VRHSWRVYCLVADGEVLFEACVTVDTSVDIPVENPVDNFGDKVSLNVTFDSGAL
jgi:hypothetical protein